jgi:hypothetical protein
MSVVVDLMTGGEGTGVGGPRSAMGLKDGLSMGRSESDRGRRRHERVYLVAFMVRP